MESQAPHDRLGVRLQLSPLDLFVRRPWVLRGGRVKAVCCGLSWIVCRVVRGFVLEHPTFGELAFESASRGIATKDAKTKDDPATAQDYIAVVMGSLEVLGTEGERDTSDVCVCFFGGEVDDVLGGKTAKGEDGVGGDLGQRRIAAHKGNTDDLGLGAHRWKMIAASHGDDLVAGLNKPHLRKDRRRDAKPLL